MLRRCIIWQTVQQAALLLLVCLLFSLMQPASCTSQQPCSVGTFPRKMMRFLNNIHSSSILATNVTKYPLGEHKQYYMKQPPDGATQHGSDSRLLPTLSQGGCWTSQSSKKQRRRRMREALNCRNMWHWMMSVGWYLASFALAVSGALLAVAVVSTFSAMATLWAYPDLPEGMQGMHA